MINAAELTTRNGVPITPNLRVRVPDGRVGIVCPAQFKWLDSSERIWVLLDEGPLVHHTPSALMAVVSTQ